MLLFEKNKKKAKNRNVTSARLFITRACYISIKKEVQLIFLLASTHLRALTNASTQGVIWSLFTRSAG